MGRCYILDKNRRPVPATWLGWAAFLDSTSDRVVAVTRVGIDRYYLDRWRAVRERTVWISTVFLGLDMRLTSSCPPLLFETMVFGGALDKQMWRHSTWEDAEEGHRLVVTQVRKEEGR